VGDTIAQTVTTTPGAQYILAFWVNDEGNTPAAMTAFWNGTAVKSLTWGATDSVKHEYTALVTGTGSDTVKLGAWGFNWWLGLDNVSLTPVPEPVTMSMLALGGLALLRRKR
jgi:hypothetical protein